MHATWNKELLRVELADLQAQAFDLEKLGFAPSRRAPRRPKRTSYRKRCNSNPPANTR